MRWPSPRWGCCSRSDRRRRCPPTAGATSSSQGARGRSTTTPRPPPRGRPPAGRRSSAATSRSRATAAPAADSRAPATPTPPSARIRRPRRTPAAPDPRFGTHPRPPEDPGCTWAEPAGPGQDFISFGRQIQNDLPTEAGELANDTDTSPDGAFVPVSTPTRERFNGRGGLDKAGARFIEDRYVLDDEDLNFRIRSTDIFNYLSPQGNANNRWRRLCGAGVVETFDNNAPIADPFVAGETRPFVIQIWDADFKDPSDADGGNQDYYIVDVFKPGTTFDVGTCQPVRNNNNPPPPPPRPRCVTACDSPTPPGPSPTATPAAGVEAAGAVSRGRARIAGARTCPVRAFSVRVTGRSIRRVTFSV